MASRSAFTPWIPVALWILVIAGLGSGEFRGDHTSRAIGPILRWLFPDWAPAERAALHGHIRKLAHLVEYAVAGLLVYRALWLTRRLPAWRAALPTLALVCAVATADELRQYVIAHRTGSPWDVALDLTGGAIGLAVAPAVVRRRDRPREPRG